MEICKYIRDNFVVRNNEEKEVNIYICANIVID
jgi:hypothetical protein